MDSTGPFLLQRKPNECRCHKIVPIDLGLPIRHAGGDPASRSAFWHTGSGVRRNDHRKYRNGISASGIRPLLHRSKRMQRSWPGKVGTALDIEAKRTLCPFSGINVPRKRCGGPHGFANSHFRFGFDSLVLLATAGSFRHDDGGKCNPAAKAGLQKEPRFWMTHINVERGEVPYPAPKPCRASA